MKSDPESTLIGPLHSALILQSAPRAEGLRSCKMVETSLNTQNQLRKGKLHLRQNTLEHLKLTQTCSKLPGATETRPRRVRAPREHRGLRPRGDDRVAKEERRRLPSPCVEQEASANPACHESTEDKVDPSSPSAAGQRSPGRKQLPPDTAPITPACAHAPGRPRKNSSHSEKRKELKEMAQDYTGKKIKEKERKRGKYWEKPTADKRLKRPRKI